MVKLSLLNQKKNWCVVANCESDEKITFKIPAKSIKFLEEGHDSTVIDFEIGDFCYIKSAYYRSPYERNKEFRIESIRKNYVTLDEATKTPLPSRDDMWDVIDITNGKKFKIKLPGWKYKIPFSEIEILKHTPEGADWNDFLKLAYQLGI